MKSRNGISREFRITIVENGVRTIYDFSFRHQRLEEWTKEKWLYYEIIDGTKKQRFKFFHTYIRIDWSELIVGEDADKLQEIRNAEFRGAKILITPHIDVPGRFFDVLSLKSDSGDSEEIKFSQSMNHPTSAGNEGTVITYVTAYPQHYWNIVNPSNQSAVSTICFEEFI